MAEAVKTYFFSVIMPAFNAEPYIARALMSVRRQSFTDWELLVVNDGSTDGTLEVIRRYQAEDSRIKVIDQANQQQGAARNAGIKAAKGTWLAFLDADDEWLPQKLAYQYRLIQENPGCQVIATSGYTRFPQEKVNAYYHGPLIPGRFKAADMYALAMFHNYLPILSVVMESALVAKAGLFDERPGIQGCEDHDYWLRLARAGAVFLTGDERTFIYHLHAGNISNQYLKQGLSSANVRLKNFDRALLSAQQTADFAADIRRTSRFLRQHRQTAAADSLIAQLRTLGIDRYHPALPARGPGRALKQTVKQILLAGCHHFWFPAQRGMEKYRTRLATEYQKWLHREQITIKGPVKISPRARITFGHQQAHIATYGIEVGDFTYLNLTTANAALITGSRFTVQKFCNFNILGKVHIGSNVQFNNYCSLNCFEAIEIGDNSWFGESVKLYDHNHRYRDKTIPFTSQGYTRGKITIGNNVWVGSNTIILQNVTIGDNCVIGANNIIYRPVPPNTIIRSGQSETF